VNKKVREIMTTEVVTVAAGTPLSSALEVFADRVIGGIPVVDENRHVVGMVTKKSLLHMFMPEYLELIEDFSFVDDFGLLETEPLEDFADALFLVVDVMEREFHTISPESSLLKAAVVMDRKDCSVLPVAGDDHVLQGIVTRTDIFRALFGTRQD